MFKTLVELQTEADTKVLAEALAAHLCASDVVLLEGGIGAGKTALARAIIQSLLSAPEDIPSPTYTVVQQYETGSFDIWHADLYRLSNIDEVIELGLIDAFETALCLIEWPDRLGAETPSGALVVELVVSDDGRTAQLSAQDQRWAGLFELFSEHA